MSERLAEMATTWQVGQFDVDDSFTQGQLIGKDTKTILDQMQCLEKTVAIFGRDDIFVRETIEPWMCERCPISPNCSIKPTSATSS